MLLYLKKSITNTLSSQFLPLFFSFVLWIFCGTDWRLCLVWQEPLGCLIAVQKVRHSTFSYLFIYLLIKRSVYRKLCFDPGLKKSHLCFAPCGLLTAHVLRSTSHRERTAKCVWNGKFLIEMGISELPAAGDRMAKQLQHLQSLCRSCLSNNQGSFKYLFETGWF